MVAGAIVGLVCAILLTLLTVRICDKLLYGPVIDELSRDKLAAELKYTVWKREAQMLAHDADYQHTLEMVELVEGKLGITGSKALTVNERAEKVLKIDGHLLRILLRRDFTPKEYKQRAANPKRMRDAKRMLDLRSLIESAATNDNERAAAQRALDRLIEKYE